MNILALDLAVQTGFAYGPAGGIPCSGTVLLKRPKDIPEIAPFNLVCWLRDFITTYAVPDLVITEAYLPPAAHKSADSIIIQFMCHGAVQAYCRCHDIRIESVPAPTIRRHFCGRAHADSRDATKNMVVGQAHMLGWLPKDSADDNRADAIAAWSFAESKYARAIPRELVLYGDGAA